MAHTYLDTLLTDRDKVRFHIGDTIDLTGDNESLTDNEVAYCLSEENDNVYRGAVLAAETLQARLRLKVTRTVGSLNTALREKIESLTEVIKQLKARAATTSVKVAAVGGVSSARNDATRSDSDYDKPAFTIGRDDYPGLAAIDDEEDDCCR